MTTTKAEQPTITQAIRDSLMTFWGAGRGSARSHKQAPPQVFDKEAARLVALIDDSTASLAAQGHKVMDLDALDWAAIKQAADESKWIPKDHYYQSDWVSDVCTFLRDGPASLAAQDGLVEALGYLESEARRFAGMYPEASDGRNTFLIYADKIASMSAIKGDKS